MIYMWFTSINYYKLAVEKDRDSIFTTIWKPGFKQSRKQVQTHIEARGNILTTHLAREDTVRQLYFKFALHNQDFCDHSRNFA
jgi:hypothetical protein